jgi:nitrogen fixation NifU-like protein
MKDNDQFDGLSPELQEKLMEYIRGQYPEGVIDHWQNPRNCRQIPQPDGYAKITSDCGSDIIEIFLKVKGDMVEDCSFQASGCLTTIACASAATEVARGKSFVRVFGMNAAQEILKTLGGLPEAKIHCAEQAAQALRRAMADCLATKNQPWKKTYRTP